MARPKKISDSGISNHNDGLMSLFLEWVWFSILFLPYVLQALYLKLVPPKPKSLHGKVVLVTGAGRGLGRELALGFARLGCKVACVDIDKDTALDTAAEIVKDGKIAKAYFTNVAKLDEIRKLKMAVTKDLGPVDILVNNASLLYARRLEDIPEEAIRAIVDVNLLSYVWMVREFVGSMKERNAGHIVTISSMSAHCPVAPISMYVACKWAITGFMESIRMEMWNEGHENINFTIIFPTYMDNIKGYLSDRQKIHVLSVESVAAQVINAVRRNIVSTTIPEPMYYTLILLKLFPIKISDWFISIVNGEAAVATQKELDILEPVIRDTIKS
ncbi:17-beta-hydroxysteroid dehydrogenase 13-like [Homalodisca vitripennis]|uniref:17-beta-hydroxysteroid dehydrogenase 13-like n=1 Tax=Homalodisca vitripennis TaxID=197043 RepID=UPI001EECB6EB|nr:17-beta-hydroxysteroid dehydrogenase 13-like [Homalodisca vitripennis]XP_046680911.1 17-beta-hydroxysteroid dehydrogenase 13-like [Homalodisca vitripennis]XP_046680913.1 17-beta-hydroxysteroid dehydrogenase 13-like [Homalodisca vitripennis]